MKVARVTLAGRHVRLEPLSLDHLPGLVAVGLDEELWRWSPTPVKDADDMRRYVETALDEERRGVSLPFALVDVASGRVAGSTRYGNVTPEHRRLEIGWTWVARDRQRTALNTEAKYLLLRHAFEELGALRVELKTDALNERSRRAIARIGAKEEGTFRRHMVTASGRYRDSVYFSVLDVEWPGVKAGLEAKLLAPAESRESSVADAVESAAAPAADAAASLVPASPLLVADRFPILADELIRLLRSLKPDDWKKPTVCPLWSVKDVAAHLLDTALRRTAAERDGWLPAPPSSAPFDLTAFLNGLNAEWVAAYRRVSPALLVDALERAEPPLAACLRAVDPFSRARFAVSWAGEAESMAWFDVARELTERWLHQQQIRLAVGAPPLTDPWLSEPVFETFLRALPDRCGRLAPAAGRALVVRVRGAREHAYSVTRDGEGAWALHRGAAPNADAEVALPEEAAWLLLTKGMSGSDARRRAQVSGSAAFADVVFGTVAVVA